MLQTFDHMHNRCTTAGHPNAYWGEHGDWLVFLGHSRDSDTVEESNFRSGLRLLGGESDTVVVERESHWAVGWVEFILIDPADVERVERATAIKDGLDNYPLIDDGDLGELEWENFWSFAEFELRQFDNWETALHAVMDEGNYFIGEETSEGEAIDAARKYLESCEELCVSHSACPIDPMQEKLFDDCPRLPNQWT